jgi:hypothetical protein
LVKCSFSFVNGSKRPFLLTGPVVRELVQIPTLAVNHVIAVAGGVGDCRNDTHIPLALRVCTFPLRGAFQGQSRSDQQAFSNSHFLHRVRFGDSLDYNLNLKLLLFGAVICFSPAARSDQT